MIQSDADLVRYHEGCRLEAYADTEGILTCGWGHTGADVTAGAVWTQDEADTHLAADLVLARARAAAALGQAWASLDEVRRAVLVDIAFQIGGAGLREFKLMLQAIIGLRYEDAAHELLSSLLTKQTPSRCYMNADMLIEGTWPQT